MSEQPLPQIKPADLLTCATLADVAKVLPKTEWEWKGRLARGYPTCVAADPGEGKSAIAFDCVKRMLTGQAWPDGSPCVKTSCVVWADTESSQGILLERATAWGIPLERVLMPLADPLGDFRIDNRKHWERFKNLVLLEKPGLVVIDSLRGAHSGKEESSAMHTIMSLVAHLARDLGICALIVHHFRKANEWEKRGGALASLDRLRGSTSISAMCRVVWGIDRPDPTSESRRLSIIKSNLCKAAEPLGFDITDKGVIWTKAPEQPRVESQQRRAADFLSDLLRHQPMTAEEVYDQARAAGISERTIQRAKGQLGVVILPPSGERKRWLWSLPSEREHWSEVYNK